MAQKSTKFFNNEEVKRKWRVIDAKGKILGRLAVEIANALRGKDKATYTPNNDCGDFIVVINASEIKTTGSKDLQKQYHRHSGFFGGYKVEKLGDLRKRRPTEPLRRAVEGMLPGNKLAARLMTKLKIYAGAEHPHQAQLAANS